MGINDIIVYIMIFFMCLGALDKCLGNRWGYGEKFTDAFKTMGPLALAMIGIVSLAPVIAELLTPIIVPLYTTLGADPSMFANTLLALDMGGYALAKEMALSPEAELFSWVFLGTMMGPTIVFTIPVALGIISKEDHPFFAKGILLGIITVPFGCLVGGLIAGFPFFMIVRNLIPALLFTLMIAVGLWWKPSMMIQGFHIFGKVIETVTMIGLAIIIIQTLTGLTLIENLTPLSEGITIVGQIAIMLAGAFPMVYFITTFFKKHLMKIGALLGIGEVATAGLVASLAHNIPTLSMMKKMDERGKVINTAFAVSGAFVFGGHLGFVAGVNKEMIFAMIVGKLAGGLSAVVLAYVATRKSNKEELEKSQLIA